MTEKDFIRQLDAATPDVPACFHQAMCQTLEQIVQEESAPDNTEEKTPRRGIRKRTLAAILIAALMLAAAAVAAVLRTDVISAFWGEDNVDADMRGLIKYNLAETTVGNCTLRIEEAAWDGASLYVLYSITDNTCDRMLGYENPRHPDWPRELRDEDYQILRDNNVGWWRDGLWIDGVDVDIPGGTIWNQYGGDKPGEMLFYQLWPLGWPVGGAVGDLELHGEVTISIPIGEQQPRESLVYDEEAGQVLMPDKGLVSFKLNLDDLTGVRTINPGVASIFPDGTTASVSEAILTPVKTYVRLDYQVPQTMMDEYIKANGEGYRNEAGELLRAYGPMYLVEDWAYGLRAVDADGRQLFDDPERAADGCQGVGNEHLWYILPSLDGVEGSVYLAPVDGEGQADMSRKILLKE